MPILLLACTANTYAGVPISADFANADLEHISRRAWAGDPWARLELGIRHEEGRGVARDAAAARRHYLHALQGPRLQTYYAGTGGAVAPVNSAVGAAPLWPRRFPDVRTAHPARLHALLRFCGLEQRPADRQECEPADVDLLRGLAGIHFENEPSGRLPPPDSTGETGPIWTMWLALKRIERCSGQDNCEVGPVERAFAASLPRQGEGSPLQQAMREALGTSSSDPRWGRICEQGGTGAQVPERGAEARICTLISMLSEKRAR